MPSPRPTRFGPSTLIEVGDKKLLIDMGRGVPIRLWQAKVPMGMIDAHFITHFHSDHVSGIPDVWLTDPALLSASKDVLAFRDGLIARDAAPKTLRVRQK